MDLKNKSIFNVEDNFLKYKQYSSVLIFGEKEKTQKPKLSICIPVYNRQEYIIDSIQSVLCQATNDVVYEVVIVHDEPISLGETLTSQAILSFDDDRIMYYRNTRNLGLFANMNRCAELARGEWIVYLHDDDLLVNNYIEIVSEMIGLNEFDGLIPEFLPFDSKIKLKAIASEVQTETPISVVKIKYHDSLLLNKNIYRAPTCGIIFNRAKFFDLGGYNEEYYPSSDWFFAFKFNYHYRLVKSKRVLGFYRLENNESFKYHTMLKFIDNFFDFRYLTKNKSILINIFRNYFINEQFYHHTAWIKKYDRDNLIDWEGLDQSRYFKIRRIRSFIYRKIRRRILNKYSLK